ncbi:MAG: hypothetical protein LBK59_11500 [Bifidobacteriaceae bacterium]|jgi:hypothetical protein|nr:hypothetical protein [Bifidobacteriaceae bacterium]
MRTTLDVDIDVLSAARDVARAERRTIGAVISDMARRGFTLGEIHDEGDAPLAPGDSGSWLRERGIATLPGGRSLVTDEQVEALRDELGI